MLLANDETIQQTILSAIFNSTLKFNITTALNGQIACDIIKKNLD